jgi:hypothetical protein
VGGADVYPNGGGLFLSPHGRNGIIDIVQIISKRR